MGLLVGSTDPLLWKVTPVSCFRRVSQDPNPKQRSPSLTPKNKLYKWARRSNLTPRSVVLVIVWKPESGKTMACLELVVESPSTAGSQMHSKVLTALKKPQPSPALEPNWSGTHTTVLNFLIFGERILNHTHTQTMHAAGNFLHRHFTYLNMFMFIFLMNEERTLSHRPITWNLYLLR